MRPRCCLRYLTLDGINMTSSQRQFVSCLGSSVSRGLPTVFRLVLLATVDPGLDPDFSVGRVRLGKAVVDVRLQRVERQPPLLVPLGAGDLGAVQPPGAADLDPLRSETERRLDPLLHR